MWKRRPDSVRDYSPHVEQPTSEQITQACADLVERYTEAQIDHFFDVLTDLPSHLVRISEEAELEEGSLRVTTKLTYQYSSERLSQNKKAQLETLLIPLFTPEKGTLIDNLRVIDGSGDEVTTLSQYDMRGLLALILETFFRLAKLAKKEAPTPGGRESTGSMTSTLVNAARGRRSWRQKHSSVPHKLLKKLAPGKFNKLLPCEKDVLDTLTRLVCHVGIPEEDDCRGAFASLGQLTSIDEQWRIRLEKFCRLYARHYTIVAEVARPSSNQVVLTYSQRLPRESSEGRKNDHLRRIFGLSPTAIDLPLALYAFLADSYHLQVNATPGQYILDHRLEEMGSRKVVEKEDLKNLFSEIDFQTEMPTLPYIRLRQGKARTNAHLYIRRQRSVSCTAELKSVFEFREIPPGTLGGAAVVAGASALIITFFAVTRFGLNGPYPGLTVGNDAVVKAALNSDLPAILLALPAFVAALIGPWSDPSRITRASLSTYFGLIMTLLLSVASVLHYILDANIKLFTEVSIGASTFTFKTEIIWLILMFVALFLFIYLISELLSQMRRYFKLIERRPVNKTADTVKNEKEEGM